MEKGMVSAVIRTRVLGRLLTDPYLVLGRPDSGYVIPAAQLDPALGPVAADLARGQISAGFAYAELADPKVKDVKPWVVTCAVPQAVLDATPAARQARVRAWLIMGGGLIVSALVAAVIGSLTRTRERAIVLANRMTADLSASERRFRTLVENLEGFEATVESAVNGGQTTRSTLVNAWRRGSMASTSARPSGMVLFIFQLPAMIGLRPAILTNSPFAAPRHLAGLCLR